MEITELLKKINEILLSENIDVSEDCKEKIELLIEVYGNTRWIDGWEDGWNALLRKLD